MCVKAFLYIHACSSVVTTFITIFAWCWFLLTVLTVLWVGCLTFPETPWAGCVSLVPFWKKLLALKPFMHSKHRKMLLRRPTCERQRSLTTAGSVCKVNSLILDDFGRNLFIRDCQHDKIVIKTLPKSRNWASHSMLWCWSPGKASDWWDVAWNELGTHTHRHTDTLYTECINL